MALRHYLRDHLRATAPEPRLREERKTASLHRKEIESSFSYRPPCQQKAAQTLAFRQRWDHSSGVFGTFQQKTRRERDSASGQNRFAILPLGHGSLTTRKRV